MRLAKAFRENFIMRYVRRAGQWFFLRLENLFNVIFGDRLNPLYHLGAIAYLMTWIAVATGVYLYAFFDTGVKEAYASLERISPRQEPVKPFQRGIERTHPCQQGLREAEQRVEKLVSKNGAFATDPLQTEDE